MKKRIVVSVVLAVLLAASAYAQTTDFFVLVETGTPQDVQAAISKGADVNSRDSARVETTPLIAAAAYNNDPAVITTLLKAGADIDARDLHYGATALMWAANNNQNPEVVATLLKAGADIKAHTEDGGTALIIAAQFNRNPEVIMVLLNAGADAKVKDSEGKTALDYAKDNWALKGTDALKQLEEASK
ncbi:MAG: ankyrin repeat domain-containing protein [Spirochaetia bacterium]